MMAEAWSYTLISVAGVSAISLIGAVTLALGRQTLDRLLLPLVGLAVGALFGGAMLHMIPHALHHTDSELLAMLLVCVGFVGFFVLDRVIGAYQHEYGLLTGIQPYVPMNLLGDGMHNLLDGMIIAAAYLADPAVGVAATVAVIFHEVPHEIGDFAILVQGGLSVAKALLFNFLSALFAVVGALVILLAGAQAENSSQWLLPIAAGAFLYLAAVKLVPELNAKAGSAAATAVHVVAIIIGISTMVLASLMETGGTH